ncbi:MAG: hydantoinase/oxoprolinase family protein [Aeoliella sp.]
MHWLGIDVGGANLKLSDGRDHAESIPFALWKNPSQLSEVLGNAIGRAPNGDAIAATMTGELADCYETKADGVRQIIDALQQASDGRTLVVYGVHGKFLSADAANESPALAAASNWHALSRFASQRLPDRTGLVIDVGSTTTDIVPVVSGQVATASHTDTNRLLAGELVYTGVGRTPICAITDRLPFRDEECPVAAELFATTADVYFLLGQEQVAEAETADGRTMTQQFAIDRLARQICTDRTAFTLDDAIVMCRHVCECQLSLLHTALDHVLQTFADKQIPTERWYPAVVSGSGEFLAHELLANREDIRDVISLAGTMKPEVSTCAAAAAVACLATAEFEP